MFNDIVIGRHLFLQVHHPLLEAPKSSEMKLKPGQCAATVSSLFVRNPKISDHYC